MAAVRNYSNEIALAGLQYANAAKDFYESEEGKKVQAVVFREASAKAQLKKRLFEESERLNQLAMQPTLKKEFSHQLEEPRKAVKPVDYSAANKAVVDALKKQLAVWYQTMDDLTKASKALLKKGDELKAELAKVEPTLLKEEQTLALTTAPHPNLSVLLEQWNAVEKTQSTEEKVIKPTLTKPETETIRSQRQRVLQEQQLLAEHLARTQAYIHQLSEHEKRAEKVVRQGLEHSQSIKANGFDIVDGLFNDDFERILEHIGSAKKQTLDLRNQMSFFAPKIVTMESQLNKLSRHINFYDFCLDPKPFFKTHHMFGTNNRTFRPVEDNMGYSPKTPFNLQFKNELK